MRSSPFIAADSLKVSFIFFFYNRFLGIEDSIKFLEDAKTRLKNQKDALLLIEISQAEKKLALGLHHDCFELLSSID